MTVHDPVAHILPDEKETQSKVGMMLGPLYVYCIMAEQVIPQLASRTANSQLQVTAQRDFFASLQVF